MYFITRNTKSGSQSDIVGIAAIKDAAWEKMRKAVIAELMNCDAWDPFAGIDEKLPQDGGGFSYGGVGASIDPIHGNTALVYDDETTVRFCITEYPDEELFGLVLHTLAENYERYGLTGKQKSQAMGLKQKLEKEDT